jgi:transcription elongation factor Elf1
MKTFSEKGIDCPHCGHHIRVSVDATNGDQSFYEDCPACCCPIHMSMHVDEVHDHVDLVVDADDEQMY